MAHIVTKMNALVTNTTLCHVKHLLDKYYPQPLAESFRFAQHEYIIKKEWKMQGLFYFFML